MTTQLRSPFGRRDSILLLAIVSAMAISACMAAEEQRQREEKVEQIKADARARLEQQEQQQEQQQEEEKQEKPETMAAREAALKEWLTKWVTDNEPYVRGLCTTDPGIEHQWIWENFKVAVSTDAQHASEAAKVARPIIDCEQFRKQERTSWSGYTWSNIEGSAS